MKAFIQAQKIFPPDAPEDDGDLTDEDMKVLFMAQGIDPKRRCEMIESAEHEID